MFWDVLDKVRFCCVTDIAMRCKMLVCVSSASQSLVMLHGAGGLMPCIGRRLTHWGL